MVEVVRAGGFDVHHDQAHGLDVDVLERADLVVAMIRRRRVAVASLAASELGPYGVEAWPWDLVQRSIRRHAPGALWVAYDALCADPHRQVARVATVLDVAPWTFTESTVCQDRKWAA